MRAAIGSTSFLLIIALAAGAALGAPGDGAQPRPGGGPGGRDSGNLPGGQPPALPDSSGIVQMVDEMTEALALTDEQREQVTKLHFAHFDEIRAQLAKGRPERSEMEALRTEFAADVKAVLRDDQMEAYENYLTSRQPRGAGRRR